MNEAFVRRKPYEWAKHPRTIRCKMCGKEYVTTSARRKYCNSTSCRRLRLKIKSNLRRERRHRLAALGIRYHTEGNK